MNVQIHPLDTAHSTKRTPSNRSTAMLLSRLMDESRNQSQTPSMGTNTAWALKLKTCVDVVAKELNVDVLSAKPIQTFGTDDRRDMLFEVDTSNGPLDVTLDRDGQHSYSWQTPAAHNA